LFQKDVSDTFDEAVKTAKENYEKLKELSEKTKNS
jgi:hypothetical protein